MSYEKGHRMTVQSAANDILWSYWPDSELPLPPFLSSVQTSMKSLHYRSSSIDGYEFVRFLFFRLTGNRYRFFSQCIKWRIAPTLRISTQLMFNRAHVTNPTRCKSLASPPTFPSHLSSSSLALLTSHRSLCSLWHSSSLFWKRAGCLMRVLRDG